MVAEPRLRSDRVPRCGSDFPGSINHSRQTRKITGNLAHYSMQVASPRMDPQAQRDDIRRLFSRQRKFNVEDLQTCFCTSSPCHEPILLLTNTRLSTLIVDTLFTGQSTPRLWLYNITAAGHSPAQIVGSLTALRVTCFVIEQVQSN